MSTHRFSVGDLIRYTEDHRGMWRADSWWNKPHLVLGLYDHRKMSGYKRGYIVACGIDIDEYGYIYIDDWEVEPYVCDR